MTTTIETAAPAIATAPKAIRTTNEIKNVMMVHVKYAFDASCKDLGIELKGPMDEETRHAAKALLRCGAEIVAGLGWGWRYAAADASAAVTNVFTYRSKAKHAAAPKAVQAPASEDEDGVDEMEFEGDEDGTEDE